MIFGFCWAAGTIEHVSVLVYLCLSLEKDPIALRLHTLILDAAIFLFWCHAISMPHYFADATRFMMAIIASALSCVCTRTNRSMPHF